MIKLFLSCVFYSLTFMTNAAIVQPTELTNSPLQFLEQKNNKTYPSTQPQPTTSHAPSTIQATELADNPKQYLEQQRETSHNAEDTHFNKPSIELVQLEDAKQPSLYSLETFTKKLNNEYGENILVQESLSMLYDAKQLWDDADSLANDFTSDVFINLKLDKFIINDLTSTQHSPQNASSYEFLKKDIRASTQHYQENAISFYQVQANTSAQGINPLINHILASLFQVTTLYYLLALSFLFMVLQWAIKFALRLFP